VEERHAREIKEAEERARAEAMEAHPGKTQHTFRDPLHTSTTPLLLLVEATQLTRGQA